MKYTVKKGTHRARPLRLGLYFRQVFNWSVRFDKTAVYDIGKPFQYDIQKLVGVRYFLGDYSARFGWRYNPEYKDKIAILAYVHDKGKVTKSENEIVMGMVDIGKWFDISLDCSFKGLYLFSLKNEILKTVKVEKTHSQKLSLRQGLYFGGNATAPHDITVEIR